MVDKDLIQRGIDRGQQDWKMVKWFARVVKHSNLPVEQVNVGFALKLYYDRFTVGEAADLIAATYDAEQMDKLTISEAAWVQHDIKMLPLVREWAADSLTEDFERDFFAL